MTAFTIPTRPDMGRGLVDHDDRNWDWPTRGVLHAADAPLVEKNWRRGYAYDQGQTSQCVAYTGKGMLNTSPTSSILSYSRRSRFVPEVFYKGAQEFDEWPGSDYEGTSARGLLNYLRSVDIITEFRWCFGVDDVLRTVSHHGPVGCGTWWSNDMFSPDSRGVVQFTGAWVGGHEWEIIGIHPSIKEVECMNSWGVGWGDRGRFRLSFDTLDQLLQAEGDAFALVVQQ